MPGWKVSGKAMHLYDSDEATVTLELPEAEVEKLVTYLHHHMTPAQSDLDQRFLDEIRYQLLDQREGGPDEFLTITLVVRAPAGTRPIDDPRPLLTDDEIMFWASEEGVTPQALTLGADPTSWEG